MARLLTAGFESGLVSVTAAYNGESDNAGTGTAQNDLNMVGTVTYQTTTARNSGRALQAGPSAGNYLQINGPVMTASRAYFVRFYFRTDDVTPSAANGVQLWVWRLNAVQAADILLAQNGTIIQRDANLATVGSTFTPSNNTWYRIEQKIIVPAAGNGTLEMKIDGVTIGSSASVDVNNALTPVTNRVGHVNSPDTTSTIYIDDLAINDDQGASENGYPGHGNITYLKPVSDNAKGTGWVAGAGGSTLYDAVDNVPPVGVAVVSATNTSQIKNASNLGAVSDYRANCQTLQAAGAPSGATCKVSQAFARVSSDDATGTNTMEVQGITPSDSAVTVDTETGQVNGDDTATPPVGWKTARTAPTYGGLTSSQTPVVEVTKTLTGAARQHQVDQMGVFAEWTYNPVITLGQPSETETALPIYPLKSTTYPNTSQLDTFTYTEDPISNGGAWGAVASFAGPGATNGTEFVSNQVGFAGEAAYRTGVSAADTEAWGTIGTLVIHYLGVRITDPGTSFDGYMLLITASSAVIQRIDNGVGTNLVTLPGAYATDDQVGLKIVGSTISAYRKVGATWYRTGEVTDSTYSAAGSVMIGAANVGTWKDFGGGSPSTTQTVTVNQISETDTSQAVTHLKTKAVGQNSETDTAQTFTHYKVTALGQNTETDTSQTLTPLKTKAIGQPSETDSAQAITKIDPILQAIGQSSETDSAQALTANKTKAIGQSSETDTAQAITKIDPILVAIGQNIETDSAQVITVVKKVTLGQATETDTAQAIASPKVKAVGQNTETDTAQAITKSKVKALGQPVTSNRTPSTGSYFTRNDVTTLDTFTTNGVLGSNWLAPWPGYGAVLGQASGGVLGRNAGATTSYYGGAWQANAFSDKIVVAITTVTANTHEFYIDAVDNLFGDPTQGFGLSVFNNNTYELFYHPYVRIAGLASLTAPTAGERFAVMLDNGTVRAFRKPSGGSWTQFASAASAGVVNKPLYGQFVASGTNNRTFDNFGISEQPSLIRIKTQTLGQNTATNAAQPITALKVKAIGQTSETDVAQPITKIDPILTSITQPSETDSAQSISVNKSRTLGQATETDTAQAITKIDPILQTVGQSSETDLAQSITSAKRLATGQASETDTAQAVSSLKTHQVGQASETDTAQAVHRVYLVPVAQASETDSNTSISIRKSQTLGQATEDDDAQSVSVRGVVSIANETDAAQSIAAKKRLAIGQSTETDLAQSVSKIKLKALGQTSESEIAQPIEAIKSNVLGLATETDSTTSISAYKSYAVGQVSETDTAQAIEMVKIIRVAIGQVSTTDSAAAIGRNKSRTTQTVFEAEAAQQITPSRGYLVDYATETDGALSLGHLKRKQIGNSREQDQAIRFTIRSPIFFPSVGNIKLVSQLRTLTHRSLKSTHDLGDNTLVIDSEKRTISVENNHFSGDLQTPQLVESTQHNDQDVLIDGSRILIQPVGTGDDEIEEFNLLTKSTDRALTLKSDDRTLTVRS